MHSSEMVYTDSAAQRKYTQVRDSHGNVIYVRDERFFDMPPPLGSDWTDYSIHEEGGQRRVKCDFGLRGLDLPPIEIRSADVIDPRIMDLLLGMKKREFLKKYTGMSELSEFVKKGKHLPVLRMYQRLCVG